MTLVSRPIRLTGVRQNNLKNLTVEIPSKKMTVITGLSGSGKSSLAFETLYAEGQRRFVESLSTYTRQFLEKMPKPEVEFVENIPPAIALEQRNSVVNSKSTVGSQTEVLDYLRLLFAKIGQVTCRHCGSKVERLSPEQMLTEAMSEFEGKKIAIVAPIRLAAAASQSGSLKKKTKKASTQSLLEIIQGQGFQRVIVKSKGSSYSMESLDDFKIESAELQELYVVIERFKAATQSVALVRAIEQALALGQGRMAFFDLDQFNSRQFTQFFACVRCGLEHRRPEPQLFSFNSPIGACAHCRGFGFNLELDEALVVPDPNKTLKNGAIDPLSKPSLVDDEKEFFKFLEKSGISTGRKYRDLSESERKLIWNGPVRKSDDDDDDDSFPGLNRFFEALSRHKYKVHIRVFIRRYQRQILCKECKGARLSADALRVTVGGRNLSEVCNLPIRDTIKWFEGLRLSRNDKKIAQDVYLQVDRRLHFLEEVGVGYLSLARTAKSLSGGEFQRINLATQLGNGLCGTLYVLDEPSIGLHPSDTQKMLNVLTQLRDQGNTLVVVEHDLEVIQSADWVIELGPGAGARGGSVVATGKVTDLKAASDSWTGKYLSGECQVKRESPERATTQKWLKLKGCRENNLKSVVLEIPLQRLVVVTGVSGSGKSTLIEKTAYRALKRHFEPEEMPLEEVGKYDSLYGAEWIKGVVLLDQSPIGKSSRSNPVTYLKAWDEIRKIYASQSLAIRRGYTPQYFSFNVDGGRCTVCAGEGEITVDMHFMAEVKLPCEECGGKRFKKPVLDITFRGKNIYDLLQMTIDDAYDMLRDLPVLRKKLALLREVGLGYLRVGQSATTLSGGESQRLKIASILDEKEGQNLLYIFDEPTTGLHQEDIRRLMLVIQDLVDKRHSVVMIEHHLHVMAQADWLVDLGPAGGDLGGEIVASGTPYDVAQSTAPDSESPSRSITGKILAESGIPLVKSLEKAKDWF